jgi:hypothetical protein
MLLVGINGGRVAVVLTGGVVMVVVVRGEEGAEG